MNFELNVRLGTVLRRIRKARKETQGVVAAAAGISVPYLSDIETGKACPPIPTFFDIAEALAVKPSTIISEIEGKKSDV